MALMMDTCVDIYANQPTATKPFKSQPKHQLQCVQQQHAARFAHQVETKEEERVIGCPPKKLAHVQLQIISTTAH